ncbi:MAG: RICIN domain-containing protein [Prevotellaceae bacterium]|jgi:glucosylceramidase|nr:RICIN domain-containing protein [Prevotellaceae bacterium]
MEKKFLTLFLIAVIAISAQAQTVQSWKTSCDESRKFQEQALKTFAEGNGSNSAKITINPATTYQSIDGFGWTMTQGSAYWLMQMSQANRTALLTEVFSQTNGFGCGFLRIGLGATDLSQGSYTCHDNQGAGFSLADYDLNTLIPVLQEIKAINPNLKLLATPWSAPAWMKNNGTLGWGGNLQTDKYAAYAQYFLNYLTAMHNLGLDVYAVSIQNEPLNGNNNPAMEMTKEQMKNFADVLGALLRNSANPAYIRNVKIIGYDHNCDNTEYPIYVAQSQYIDGTAFHLYAGEISAMTTVHNQTGKDVYFTEQYTGGSGGFWGDFEWHIKNVMLGSVNNWGKTAIEWNFASNENWQPYLAGTCSDCKGAVTINSSTKAVTRNVAYYTVAHFAQAAKFGAAKIGATSTDNNLKTAAFQNANGSIGFVVFNDANGSKTFDVNFNDNFFSYSIEGKTIATFVWNVSNEPTVPVESVSVSPNSLILNKNQTAQLTANIFPQNATVQTVDWASGNANIASVNSLGVVTAKSAGNTVITATTLNGSKTAICSLTVNSSQTQLNFADIYYIYSVYSDKVIEVKNNNLNTGATLQQYSLREENNNENQRWILENAGGDNYYIRSKFSNFYLQAMGNGDGAEVTLQQYSGLFSQQWTVTEEESNIYSIVSRYAQKSLDVDGPSTDDGKKIQLWGDYEGQTNRQWRFEVAETVSGIGEMQENDVFIFPNPATTELKIKNGKWKIEDKVEICDITGKILSFFLDNYRDNSQFSISVSDLPQGVYFLKIANKTFKFIKQ